MSCRAVADESDHPALKKAIRALHADLVMLGRLSLALSRARSAM
jgi:hypothetical protein